MARIRRFAGDERGSPTVEFVLWMPVFVLILALIVNASLLLHEKSKMSIIAREAARQRAIGALPTDAAARTYLRSLLPNATYYYGDVNTIAGGTLVESKVQFKPAGVILFGKSIVGQILGQNYIMSTEIYMSLES